MSYSRRFFDTKRAAILRLIFLSCFVSFVYLYHISQAARATQPTTIAPSNGLVEDDLRINATYEPVLDLPSTDFIDLAENDDGPIKVYNPYPDYNSASWKSKWTGSHQPCLGPRGVNVNNNPDDMIRVRIADASAPNPEPMFGSYHQIGLDFGQCIDRSGRLDAYGFEENENDNTTRWSRPSKVNWTAVDWGSLQDQCLARNKDRYAKAEKNNLALQYPSMEDVLNTLPSPKEKEQVSLGLTRLGRSMSSPSPKHFHSRTAIILRAWDTMEYTPDILHTIRSLITELSLHSGGEYTIHLFVHIKDFPEKIFHSPSAYQRAMTLYVPREFHSITTLFDNPLLHSWYPKVDPAGGQMAHMDQPLQIFSLLHPEYAHYWQLELDTRYTGHWYTLLTSLSTWARAQPRKLQWERAEKYYMPSVHKTYANFSAVIDAENPDGGIWGPLHSDAVPNPIGPVPPIRRPRGDPNSTWGIGEDADVLALGPIVDTHPAMSSVLSLGVVKSFPDGKGGEANIARRGLCQTPLVRVSKSLLRVMHAAAMEHGVDMIPEVGPETFALLHGLKVAVAPLPMFAGLGEMALEERRLLPAAIEERMNKQGFESVFGFARETWMDVPGSGLFTRFTYWWTLPGGPPYPQQLYKRWLGLREEGDEGREPGRLCMPGVLLHPVKDVK